MLLGSRKSLLATSVHVTRVGYAGGTSADPSYEEVCSGTTRHVEVVQIVFDPLKVSIKDLLQAFWEGHDPTQGIRQGNDIGSQYRSIILWSSPQQTKIITDTLETYQAALTKEGYSKITTDVAKLEKFYMSFFRVRANFSLDLSFQGISCIVAKKSVSGVGAVHRAYKLKHHANAGKIESVRGLLPHWQKHLNIFVYRYVNLLRSTGRLPAHLSDLKYEKSALSHTQLCSVSSQARGAVASWIETFPDLVRPYIRDSKLSTEDKSTLYRLNMARAWYHKKYTLGKTEVPVHLLKILRHIARHVIKVNHPVPDLSRCRSMSMQGNIGKTGDAVTEKFDKWVKISTLTKRKPVAIPLTLHNYMEDAAGEYSNFVQVHVKNDGTIDFAFIKKSDKVDLRTSGETVGLDWGLNSMFATSQGELLGLQLYPWLKKIDGELTDLTRELQRHGIRPSSSKRYRQFQNRIRSYVKNEVGRTLNKLATKDIKELVVESLDFRGVGLSSRLNRIVSRAGRATIKTKLTSLEETRGIKVTAVNAAYTSQKCSGCGYTHKLNRKGTSFRCRFCFKSLHADINAARNLVVRCSDDPHGYQYISTSKVKSILDEKFHVKWNLSPEMFFNISIRR